MDSKLYDFFFGWPEAEFFDFSPVWKKLEYESLPDIIRRQPDGTILKAWIIACSTGQVAYSLAMIFKENIELLRPNSGITLQITATDINSRRIEFARNGIYDNTTGISKERLIRFFNNSCQIKDELRDMINFEVHNVLTDPPFAGNSFISCSNFVHWIRLEEQKKLVTSIYDNLIPGGVWWHLHKIFLKDDGFVESEFKGWSYIGQPKKTTASDVKHLQKLLELNTAKLFEMRKYLDTPEKLAQIAEPYLKKNPLICPVFGWPVDQFFNYPAILNNVRDIAIPKIISNHTDGTILKAWVPACSTGGGAFTLAILFQEAAKKMNTKTKLKIIATDINTSRLEYAKKAIYPLRNDNFASFLRIKNDDELTKKRLRTFFHKRNGGYQVNKEIRAMVDFRIHNLLNDPPPILGVSIISCFYALRELCARKILDKEGLTRIMKTFFDSMEAGGLFYDEGSFYFRKDKFEQTLVLNG